MYWFDWQEDLLAMFEIENDFPIIQLQVYIFYYVSRELILLNNDDRSCFEDNII